MKRVVILVALALVGCKDKKNSASSGEPDESKQGEASSATSQAEPTAIDSPKPSSDGAVAAHGDHIYWIAGTTGRPDKLTRRFDVKSSKWEKLAELNQARLNLAGVSAANRIYAIGGMKNVGRHSPVVESYDPSTHQWSAVARLPTSVGDPAAAAVGDVIYVFGGNKVLNSNLRNYDAASVATTVAIGEAGKSVKELEPMPTAREEAAAVTVDKKIYVLGGVISTSGEDTAVPPKTSIVEIYDTETNSWSEGPEMPRRASGSAALLGKELVFFGDGALNPDEPMILDVESGEWRSGKPRDSKTIGSTVEGAVVVGTKLYVVTQVLRGFSEPAIPHVFDYSPKDDTWTKVF